MLEANVLPFSAGHLAGFDLRRSKNNQIPLLPLPPKGHYPLPSLLRDEGSAVQTDTGPILLHLRLESGLLLDLPLSQETIDGLILTLGHMTTLK